MSKTFDKSLIDTAVISMSMIDPEDMQDTTSEEFTSLRRIQQGCHSELTSREDFPFNKRTVTAELEAGQKNIPFPEGTISKIWLEGSTTPLNYITDKLKVATDSTGTPTAYYVDYENEAIVLYPTPNKDIKCFVEYKDTKNIIDALGNASYEITVGSTLKMPDRIQHMYFDALEYRVLFEYMRKQTNPRWQPTELLFNEKWKVFLKACKATDSDTYFVI